MDSAMPEAARDEALFIDHERSRAQVVDDVVLVEPDHPSPVVLFECLSRRPDLTRDGFAAAWREHGEEARRDCSLGLLGGYVQSHVRPDAGGGVDRFDELGTGGEHWDGIGALYFPSVVVARSYLERPDRAALASRVEFVDPRRTVWMLAHRHPRRDPVR